MPCSTNRSATVSQVARRADLPVATAHRLVVALLAHGFLERSGDGLLRVQLGVLEGDDVLFIERLSARDAVVT